LTYWILLKLLEQRPDAVDITSGEEIAVKALANQYDLSEAGVPANEIGEVIVKQWDLVPKIGRRLMENLGNETDRKIVLYYKHQLPLKLWDQKSEKEYFGKEAIDVFLQRLEEKYDGKIFSMYPDGKMGMYNEDLRDFYYSWLGDRQGHGLNYTVYQYIDIKLGEAGRLASRKYFTSTPVSSCFSSTAADIPSLR
jgi:hypothetical protein